MLWKKVVGCVSTSLISCLSVTNADYSNISSYNNGCKGYSILNIVEILNIRSYFINYNNIFYKLGFNINKKKCQFVFQHYLLSYWNI